MPDDGDPPRKSINWGALGAIGGAGAAIVAVVALIVAIQQRDADKDEQMRADLARLTERVSALKDQLDRIPEGPPGPTGAQGPRGKYGVAPLEQSSHLTYPSAAQMAGSTSLQLRQKTLRTHVYLSRATYDPDGSFCIKYPRYVWRTS